MKSEVGDPLRNVDCVSPITQKEFKSVLKLRLIEFSSKNFPRVYTLVLSMLPFILTWVFCSRVCG